MLRFLFRKMWNTRWLTFTTLLGLIIAVAFTASIPMYSDGALKRVVAKSLEEKNSGLPAGSILIRYQAVGNARADMKDFDNVHTFITEDIPQEIGFPHFTYGQYLSLRGTNIKPVDAEKVDASRRRSMTMIAMADLAEQIELTNGKLYSDHISDDVIEAIVYEEAMYRNDFRVGDEFYYQVTTGQGMKSLKVKVVGSFKPLNDTNPYWYQGFDGLSNSLIISNTVMRDELLEKMQISLNLANWYYAFDLREIKTSQLGPLSSALNRMDIDVFQKLNGTHVAFSFKDMLADFRSESLHLQMLLLTLAAPMIAMVFYYIAMNSRQSLDRQRSDIAVLRSRGASTRQIIWIYLLEGILLGGIALVIGPLIGWFMAKSIGSSNGFLTFVDRESIPVDVSVNSILYASLAVLIALGSALIPAIMFARSTIVDLKKQMARGDRKPMWQRFYMDIVLLALSGYGWYMFNQNQMVSMSTGLSNEQLQVNPLLFFVPALSIFSLGLFFLRIFPWLLKLFNWLGGKFLPVPLYLTLAQLSRSSKAYYPLMILLILTLGLGVYNSSAARTIDLNSTEQTMYRYGTDIIVKTVWEGFGVTIPATPPGNDGGNDGGNNGNPGGQPGGGEQTPTQQMLYREPPFELFRTLEGVQAAAKVLKTNTNIVVSGRTKGQGTLFAIENDQFDDVAWFRDDLLPLHQNLYLNALGQFEQAVIVSDKFAAENQLKPGDSISLIIQQNRLEFVIVATVPYWPTQYPDEEPFFITNLAFIYDQMPLIPYEVWLKMDDGALLAPVIEGLQQSGITISSYDDVRRELLTQSKLPSRGGVFGILSLGFLISVIISFIGYVLYWFFNLSSRVVQFGVLRAMGLSRRQLTGMLLLEQGFTAGLSIALGIGIGKLVSYLYLPFLQTTENVKQQVPPFRVIFDSKDNLALYTVVFFMMAIGAILLFMHIRRLRVHQAVKLGEER